jgi:hypothetical protein
MNLDDLTVLIIGFDPYKDVWDIFFELFNKNWKDHPRTLLSTNTLTPQYPNIEVIPNSEEAEWSMKVINACQKIETKYICLLLEDFFISSSVDNELISQRLNMMKQGNIQYLKLLDQRVNNKEIYENNEEIGIIETGLQYGISLQPAIWEKTFLLNLIGKENYNAWIFELNQVKNPIQNINGVNCLEDFSNPLHIIHGVVQQEYLPQAVRSLKKLGIDVTKGKRRIMSGKKYFKYKVKLIACFHSPIFLKKPLKRIGRLMGVDFVSDRELGGK